MKRTVFIVATLAALSCPVLAQDYDLRPPSIQDLMPDYLQPAQPLRPLVPTYQPPTRDYRIHVPPVPTHNPAPRIDWRDRVDNAMRGMPRVTPQMQQQFRDADIASQRRNWADCAKYNRLLCEHAAVVRRAVEDAGKEAESRETAGWITATWGGHAVLSRGRSRHAAGPAFDQSAHVEFRASQHGEHQKVGGNQAASCSAFPAVSSFFSPGYHCWGVPKTRGQLRIWVGSKIPKLRLSSTLYNFNGCQCV